MAAPGIDLTKVPMARNPNGDPPDFDHGPSLAGSVQGVGVILATVTLALLVTRLRVYGKANRGLLWDDIFLILSYIMALMYTVLASTLGRLCRHTWDTPLSEINEDYMKKLVSTTIVVGPMNFFAKAAILMLYYRVFNVEVWMRRACSILGIFFVAAYWQTVPQNFVWCMPKPGNPWDATVLQRCNHLNIPGLVHGTTNCVADIILVVLPLPIIKKLHVSINKKVALFGIFATAILALICSILGIYYRVQISYGNDPVWSNAQAWIVIQGEVYVAICVACAPSLAKIWKSDSDQTRLYKTVMSILNAGRSTKQGSYSSTQGPVSPNKSVSALYQKQSFTTKRAGHSISSILGSDGYEIMHDLPYLNSVRREVEIEVTSEACRNDIV